MVRIARSRSKSSSRISVIHLFITSVLCCLSFYCGALTGVKPGVSCPEVVPSTLEKTAPANNVVDNAKIEAVVQQRVEAGESSSNGFCQGSATM